MPQTFDCPKCGAPYSIAVDGHGRVYVGDMKGIQVFDANGRYLNIVKLKGMAFGMVFNDKNELFVIARDHVIKIRRPGAMNQVPTRTSFGSSVLR